MKSYECKFSKLGDEPSLKACWAGVAYRSSYSKGTVIIIDNYKDDTTKKYIPLLIKLINEIQPCKIVEQNGHEYISYELIGLYNHDLILLNFIRNLWNEYLDGYSKRFFEELAKLDKTKLSAMEKLLTANQVACEQLNFTYNGDHSNCHNYIKLKVKKVDDNFYKVDSSGTRNYLTN